MPASRKLFTERTKAQPATLSYAIPSNVRVRVLHVVHELAPYVATLPHLWLDVGNRCISQYGGLAGEALNSFPGKPQEYQVFAHAAKCSDSQFIDFIEMCFQSSYFKGRQPVVDKINDVFKSENIGYELSPFVTRQVPAKVPSPPTTKLPKNAGITGVVSFRHTAIVPPKRPARPAKVVPVMEEVIDAYPMATVKSNEFLHSTTVMPVLHMLTDPRFKTADEEMLAAHKHFREGDYGAALNECGKAFESVFKTILTLKGWPYDPNKDTISKLIDIARDNGLFPAYYVEELKFVGTVRNKLGSHGGGPNLPHGKPDERHAEHHVHVTASHILFLVRMAGL